MIDYVWLLLLLSSNNDDDDYITAVSLDSVDRPTQHHQQCKDDAELSMFRLHTTQEAQLLKQALQCTERMLIQISPHVGL